MNFRDSFKTTTASKPSYNPSFPAQSKPIFTSSSFKLTCPSSTKSTIFKRKTASEPTKANPRTHCYRCQRYGHFATKCPSQTKTFLMKVSIEDIKEEDGLEVIVYQDDNSDTSAEDSKFSGCIRILTSTDLTSGCDRAHLGVVGVLQRGPTSQ